MDPSMGLTSRWKKRFFALRFQSASGPLVLEINKDEKRTSTVKEVVDLSECRGIEVCSDLSCHSVPRYDLSCHSVLFVCQKSVSVPLSFKKSR
jgi:hypothetical protein